ncbi:c-type cytochrome [Roseateles sp. DXS20W]|uniref:C-type cytochrome n=1 Tax=Pelomonas lactea TaxID=3299030 RepID=A0ABW7GJE4_9BURK
MTPDPQISAQQQRENPDPHEQTQPVPWPLIMLVALLFAFGIAYISQADIESPAAWGDGRQAAELSGSKGRGAAKADGAALFASLCAACHQANGQGLPGVFPPLAGSEWVSGKDSTASAIVLHGITGNLSVKGSSYNGAMPAFGGQLSDEQVAAVLTYVRSQWGNSAAAVSAETVAQVREAHKERTTPFTGDKDLPPHD